MKQTLLPEWAPVSKVLLAWPYPGSDWDVSLEQVQMCYCGIVKSLSEKATVVVLLHPAVDKAGFMLSLKTHGVEKSRLIILGDIAYDDTWIRDYGPLSLVDSYLTFSFDGWGKKYSSNKDNAVPSKLPSNVLAKPLIENPLVVEGGSIDVNDDGVLLANSTCLLDPIRNPEGSADQIQRQLVELLGLSKMVLLNDICLSGDDTDGHIDTITRFVSNSVLVYAGRSATHPDALILEDLHAQVIAVAQSNAWEAFELPSPVLLSQVDGRVLPATYTNYLYCNDAVFVPVYGVPDDELALEVYRKALAGCAAQVIPVRCEALLEQHGSLHCATMQLHHE